MNHVMDFDVIIIGSGLVGSSLALALKHSGLKLALVEKQPPQPLPGDASWDSRIYAISPGSAAFLKTLGIWDELDHKRMTPVHEIGRAHV